MNISEQFDFDKRPIATPYAHGAHARVYTAERHPEEDVMCEKNKNEPEFSLASPKTLNFQRNPSQPAPRPALLQKHKRNPSPRFARDVDLSLLAGFEREDEFIPPCSARGIEAELVPPRIRWFVAR
jgi:hypothetical protein